MFCVTSGVDVGFEFQYTTNRQEHLDYPVQFEHPLPEWLTGVYVSIIFSAYVFMIVRIK